MSRVNLEVSSATISINLIFRALGMALLTVPLATLAVSSLKAEDMPQGTAINNMMRQLGGSFGISIINTYIARRIALHRTDLISNLSADNRFVTDRLQSYTSVFQSRGFGFPEARQKAIALLEKIVVQQSSFLSYIDAYLAIGLAFILVLPLLLFFIKKNKNKKMVIVSADH
ncbi:hypothetical protein [Chryseobacterium tongliaoense]|uniref:hypothetical protein n=1 Tax=Chryseobacterium tongliaoense TaxID=3240933 RepID=UPI0035136517